MLNISARYRIRRSDLEASSSPPPSEPDAELAAQYRARLAEIYGATALVSDLPAPKVSPGEREKEEEQEGAQEVFEFRLFGNDSKATEDADEIVEAQKIILRRGDEDGGEGGFVKTRDPRVFVVERAQGERKADFQNVAVSGKDVLDAARKRAWGLEVPWRVKVIRVVGKQKLGGEVSDVVIHVEDSTVSAKKKRPGKKRRILLRGRKKAREELAEKMKLDAASREEAEREKRTRRNREKKVKRRLKEKALKSSGGVEATNTGDNGADTNANPNPNANIND